MDARRRDEVQRPTVQYKVVVTVEGMDEPITKIIPCNPIVTAFGWLIKVDFMDGEIIYGKISFIQVNEVKG